MFKNWSQRWRSMFSEPAWPCSKSMTIVPFPLLHSSNYVKLTGNAPYSSFLSLTFFFYIPWGFHTTHLPHEKHAMIHIDLIGQIKSWEKTCLSFSYKTTNEIPPEPLTLSRWIFLSLTFSSQCLTLSSTKSNFTMPQGVIQNHTSKLSSSN